MTMITYYVVTLIALVSGTAFAEERFEVQQAGHTYSLINVTENEAWEKGMFCGGNPNHDQYITDELRYDLCKLSYQRAGKVFKTSFVKQCFKDEGHSMIEKTPCFVFCHETSRFDEDGEWKENTHCGNSRHDVLLLTNHQCGPNHFCNKDGCCVEKVDPTTTLTPEPTTTPRPTTVTEPVTTTELTTTSNVTEPNITPNVTQPVTPTISNVTSNVTESVTSTEPTVISNVTQPANTTVTTLDPTGQCVIEQNVTPTEVTPIDPIITPNVTEPIITTHTPNVTTPEPPTPTPTPEPPTPSPKPPRKRHSCTSSGYFPDKENPQFYYHCKFFAAIHSCGEDQVFDVAHGECVYDVKAEDPALEFSKWKHAITCPKFGTYLRSPYDCRYFYFCEPNGDHGFRVYFNYCFGGLVFNETSQSCEFKTRRCHNLLSLPNEHNEPHKNNEDDIVISAL